MRNSNSSWCKWRTLVASTLIGVFWCVLWVPHSCLQYGMGVIGWKETWVSQSMVGWNVVVPSLVGSLNLLMKNSFPWFSCANVLIYIWVLMADMFIIFLFLLCCLYAHLTQRVLHKDPSRLEIKFSSGTMHMKKKGNIPNFKNYGLVHFRLLNRQAHLHLCFKIYQERGILLL